VGEHLVGKGDNEVERVDGMNSTEDGSPNRESLKGDKGRRGGRVSLGAQGVWRKGGEQEIESFENG
jgi:hypothetical protein